MVDHEYWFGSCSFTSSITDNFGGYFVHSNLLGMVPKGSSFHSLQPGADTTCPTKDVFC
jgi:hypothetical protein